MILVDTSVLINFLKGQNGEKVSLFESILKSGIPFGISAFTYQELLQGARDDSEYEKLRSYLVTNTIYYPPESNVFYENASRMYFDLRRKGVTVHSTIDMLIAQTAIVNNLKLLHDDRDFDAIAAAVPELGILS